MSRKRAKGESEATTTNTSLPALPGGWCWADLSQLAAPERNAITDGPFGSNLKTEHYSESGPRVVRLQNIGDGVFRDERAFITEDHFSKLQKHSVLPNDLIIAALGETLPRACLAPDWLGPAIVKADCIRLRPDSACIMPPYLNFALNSPETRRRTETIIHGVGRPRLNLGEIKGLLVPVAPLNEQRRIVAKLEELLSDLDAGVAALERAKASLKRYRAAVLKAAVEGKLTEEWRAKHPKTEPASKLLERILSDRHKKWEEEQLAKFAATEKTPPQGWQQRYVEPVPPDFTDVPCIPEKWTIASIDQLTTTITSGSRDWSQYYDEGSGTFIMAQNVRPGHLDLTYRQAVNPPPGDRDRVRSQVQCDDLLVTIVGANTGDVCRVPEDLAEHYVCQSVALMRPVLADVAAFAEMYFVADHGGQKQFQRYIYGQGRPHLGFDELRTTPVVLPPLAEQRPLVEDVAGRLSVVVSAEQQVAENLVRTSRLRQCILKCAFEGKLVPQDPNDEPASVLLERIKAASNGEHR